MLVSECYKCTRKLNNPKIKKGKQYKNLDILHARLHMQFVIFTYKENAVIQKFVQFGRDNVDTENPFLLYNSRISSNKV